MGANEIFPITIRLIQKEVNSKPNLTERALLEEFMNLNSDSEKVNFAYNLLQSHDLFPRFVRDGKSDEIAKRHRKDGNEMFALGLFLAALKIYTCSIRTAESKDVLALAYANRSACLLKLEMVQECLTDIERALENGYPQNLMPKLLSRKKAALKALTLIATVTPWHEEIPTIPESRRNKLIQCAKDCVEIRTSEQYGRHIVATSDIEIGEVIAVENPFTFVAAKEKLIHCRECLKVCYNLLPCPNCSHGLYCSEGCKEKALDYHKYECAVLSTFEAFNVEDFELLAVKATVLSLDEEILEDLVYRSDRYKEIHCLTHHADKLPQVFVLGKAVRAAMFFKILKYDSDLFQDKPFEEKFKANLYMQLQVCNLNNMAIQEFYPPSPTKNCTIGQGLFSFGSLLNHSCCPNVERYSYGSAVVLRASCTIKKGEQCFICYGPGYDEALKFERQLRLAPHFFTCTCEACTHDWSESEGVEGNALFSSLNADPADFLDKLEKLEVCDMNVAREMLDEMMPILKEFEPRSSREDIEGMKPIVFACYLVFGNKRKI